MVVFWLLGTETMKSHGYDNCSGVWDSFPLKMNVHLTVQDIL